MGERRVFWSDIDYLGGPGRQLLLNAIREYLTAPNNHSIRIVSLIASLILIYPDIRSELLGQLSTLPVSAQLRWVAALDDYFFNSSEIRRNMAGRSESFAQIWQLLSAAGSLNDHGFPALGSSHDAIEAFYNDLINHEMVGRLGVTATSQYLEREINARHLDPGLMEDALSYIFLQYLMHNHPPRDKTRVTDEYTVWIEMRREPTAFARLLMLGGNVLALKHRFLEYRLEP